MCARNAQDRLAYIRTKYSAEAAALGRKHSLEKRRREAIQQARHCAALRQRGWTLARIADAFNISMRTVQRHLKSNAHRIKLLACAVRFIDWTFGKEKSCTDPSKDLDPGTEKTLRNDHAPQLSRPMTGGDEKKTSLSEVHRARLI